VLLVQMEVVLDHRALQVEGEMQGEPMKLPNAPRKWSQR